MPLNPNYSNNNKDTTIHYICQGLQRGKQALKKKNKDTQIEHL